MVGIIPKPIKKTPRIYELAPYIAFGLAGAVVLAYAALFYFESKTLNDLSSLEKQITQVGTQEEKALEAQVMLDKQRIDDFSQLLKNHSLTSNFFKFLEENSHPKIWFSKLDLAVGDSQAEISGETSNFQTFGQQVALFQESEWIENIDISDLNIGKTGRANFAITLFLNPKIFADE